MKHKRVSVLIQGMVLLCMVLAWGMVLGPHFIFPGPFGALPWIAMASMQVSGTLAAVCIVVCLLTYGLIFLGFHIGLKGKRWALFLGTMALCLDLASMIVFTAFSWWFLMGAVLDALLIGSLWYLALKKA